MQNHSSSKSINSEETNSNSHSPSGTPKKLTILELEKGLMETSVKTQKKNDPKYKTELCKKFAEKGFCPYGSKCRFAHGKEDLYLKVITSKMYKQKQCNSFFHKFYCNYGSRCHFKHDERKVCEINKSFFTHLIDNLSLISPKQIYEMNDVSLSELIVNETPKNIRKFFSRFM